MDADFPEEPDTGLGVSAHQQSALGWATAEPLDFQRDCSSD